MLSEVAGDCEVKKIKLRGELEKDRNYTINDILMKR